MTTLVYNHARNLLGTAGINWPTAAAHALLLNAAYSPSPSDVHLSDIPAGAIMQDVVMTSLAISSTGVCYGVIPEFTAYSSPSTVVAVAIYISTGDPTTSPLVYYSDAGVGFPFQPQGFNYFVGYDQANGGFFQA